MKRCIVSLILVLLTSAVVQGHFIWVVPDEDGERAKVIFSETLKLEDPALLEKISELKLVPRDVRAEVKGKKEKGFIHVSVPSSKPGVISGVCEYGVVAKGREKPYLLKYYATGYLRPDPDGGVTPEPKVVAWEPLHLEILPKGNSGGFPLYEVHWKGKPVADAEVVFYRPDKDKPDVKTTDKEGMVNFNTQDHPPGLYAVRARHIEAKGGVFADKKYDEIRHYSTLVFRVPESKKAAKKPDLKEDPAASKLLKDARAARARWKDFLGFSADIEVNLDGTTTKGKLAVDAKGKVTLTGLDDAAEKWAKRELASLVSHRLDDAATRDTPCAFADDVKNHPLGRRIVVLNDELHSSYRIAGNRLVVVERATPESRFTITVLEYQPNEEDKLLSTRFVVNSWDPKTGALIRSDANSQLFKRIGAFDLPWALGQISSLPDSKDAKEAKEAAVKQLMLSNWKLVEKAKE